VAVADDCSAGHLPVVGHMGGRATESCSVPRPRSCGRQAAARRRRPAEAAAGALTTLVRVAASGIPGSPLGTLAAARAPGGGAPASSRRVRSCPMAAPGGSARRRAPLPSPADASAAGRVDCGKGRESDHESAADDAGRAEFEPSGRVSRGARRAPSHGLRCARACRGPFVSCLSDSAGENERAERQCPQEQGDHEDVDASGYHVSTIVRERLVRNRPNGLSCPACRGRERHSRMPGFSRRRMRSVAPSPCASTPPQPPPS
jgi:hypothetical protein